MQEHRPFLPYGFLFNPTDEVLLQRYLKPKVLGILDKIVPVVDSFLRDCDLYEKQPSEIWASHGGPLLDVNEDLYFFTQLKKKTSKGSRINRKVGSSGAWQNEDAGKDIFAGNSKQLIGSKKRYRYENKGYKDHGAWIMHEYTLHQSMLPQNQSTNYVLCILRKNPSTVKQENLALPKKRKVMEVDQSEEKLEKLLARKRNRVECQIEQTASVVRMAEEEQICSTNNDNQFVEEIEKLLNTEECRSEAPGSVVTIVPDFNRSTHGRKETCCGTCCYTQNADEQNAMLNNMILSDHQFVPHDGRENTGGINYSCNTYEVGEQYDVKMPEADQTVQTWSMMQQACSNSDPVNDLSNEDICFLRKIFPGAECEKAMEQDGSCSMMLSEQCLSGNNGHRISGMDYSSSVAEQQHEAALNWPDQIIQCADRNSNLQVNNHPSRVNNLECQREAPMAMMNDFQQILFENPSASENGNLERQETGGIVYDVPVEVVDDEMLQSHDMVQSEEWSDSDLLVEITEEGFIKFG